MCEARQYSSSAMGNVSCFSPIKLLHNYRQSVNVQAPLDPCDDYRTAIIMALYGLGDRSGSTQDDIFAYITDNICETASTPDLQSAFLKCRRQGLIMSLYPICHNPLEAPPTIRYVLATDMDKYEANKKYVIYLLQLAGFSTFWFSPYCSTDTPQFSLDGC